MDLRDLSAKEWLLLSARAEELCVERLGELANRVTDPELADTLREMASEEDDHSAAIASVDAEVDWPEVWHIDEPAIHQILATHFPTLVGGCGRNEQEAIGEFVTQVELESVRFYDLLADCAGQMSLRRFFRRMATCERQHAKGHGFGR
jgi:rubrerythrin